MARCGIIKHREALEMHGRKMIAPIVISVLIVIMYVTMAIGVFVLNLAFVAKLLFIIIPLALSGVMIYVLVERIKEIRGGEEDDIGKY
jgi:hypothetical protein